MKTVTGQVGVWLSQYAIATPEDVANGDASIIDSLSFFRPGHDVASQGYTFVGTATVTLERPSVDDLVQNKVKALEAQRDQIRADAYQQARALDEQIQSLLAISYDGAA